MSLSPKVPHSVASYHPTPSIKHPQPQSNPTPLFLSQPNLLKPKQKTFPETKLPHPHSGNATHLQTLHHNANLPPLLPPPPRNPPQNLDPRHPPRLSRRALLQHLDNRRPPLPHRLGLVRRRMRRPTRCIQRLPQRAALSTPRTRTGLCLDTATKPMSLVRTAGT